MPYMLPLLVKTNQALGITPFIIGTIGVREKAL
jgi:hypothetical protein